jgi:DNA-binding LacI/PurR family transcriptional regulator
VLASAGAASGAQEMVAAFQVEHLITRGHRRLAIAGPAEPGLEFFVTGRDAGARGAAAARGAEIVDSVAFAVDGSNAAEVMTAWKAAGVTGVVAYNDEVAMRVLYGIRIAGLSSPADFAVIGVDNLPVSQVSDPPLSSVEFLTDRYADALAAELLGVSAVPAAGPESIMRLVRRASS